MNRLGVTADATSIGILIAALALWAQLWVNYSKKIEYSPSIKDTPQEANRGRTVSIGLLWIYMAIFFGIVAFAFMTVNFGGITATKLGQVFFVASLIMAITNIAESGFTLMYKVMIGEPHNKLREASFENYFYMAPFIIALIALVLLGSFLAVLLSIWLGLLIWLIALTLGFYTYLHLN